ncbi:unnamed protein product, partial [Mesorhabditis spiculigera]
MAEKGKGLLEDGLAHFTNKFNTFNRDLEVAIGAYQHETKAVLDGMRPDGHAEAEERLNFVRNTISRLQTAMEEWLPDGTRLLNTIRHLTTATRQANAQATPTTR